MKTIQEEIDFYIEQNYGEDADNFAGAISNYAEGLKNGVKFAQRWIPIDEELPPFERVILKSESGYVEVRTITKHHIVDGKLTITLSGIKVVEWRLIEIK